MTAKGDPNGHKCKYCNLELFGRRTKFCSSKCKREYEKELNKKLRKERKKNKIKDVSYCVICNKQLKGKKRKYCCLKCKKTGIRTKVSDSYYEDREKVIERKKHKNHNLDEIAKKAREAGLSYGHYVSMMGGYT